MKCSSCGADNINGSSFCVKCGANLVNQQVSNPSVSNDQSNQNIASNLPDNNQMNSNITNNPSDPNLVDNGTNSNLNSLNNPAGNATNGNDNNSNNQQSSGETNVAVSTEPIKYPAFIFSFLLHPFKTYKDEETKLSNSKNSLILASIVVVAMVLFGFLSNAINVVFSKQMDYKMSKLKTVVDFKNLKLLDYKTLLGKNLLIYAGVILLVTIVFYIANLIVKKSPNFMKLLSISAVSFLPVAVVTMLASPIVARISYAVSAVLSIIGIIYTIVVLFVLINHESNIEAGDVKIYYNAICASVIAIGLYFLLSRLIMGIVAGGISNSISNSLMDLLN